MYFFTGLTSILRGRRPAAKSLIFALAALKRKHPDAKLVLHLRDGETQPPKKVTALFHHVYESSTDTKRFAELCRSFAGNNPSYDVDFLEDPPTLTVPLWGGSQQERDKIAEAQKYMAGLGADFSVIEKQTPQNIALELAFDPYRCAAAFCHSKGLKDRLVIVVSVGKFARGKVSVMAESLEDGPIRKLAASLKEGRPFLARRTGYQWRTRLELPTIR